MEHRLARAWAYVQDRSITVLDFALARYLRGSEVTASDNLGIGSLGETVDVEPLPIVKNGMAA